MAIAAGTVWEVRTTGADTNAGGWNPARGGGGTDYSQQDAAQWSATDLAADAAHTTNRRVSSATHTFVTADVGNLIRVPASTGWTAGVYEVTSINASPNYAVLDRAAATNGATNGTCALGGALLSPALATAAAVAQNVVYLASGTYNITSTSSNVAGGRLTTTTSASTVAAPYRLLGYKAGAARTDQTARPKLQAASSYNGTLLTLGSGGYQFVQAIDFDGASSATCRGIVTGAHTQRIDSCDGTNMGNLLIDSASIYAVATRCRNVSGSSGGFAVSCIGCECPAGAFTVTNGVVIAFCSGHVSAGNSGIVLCHTEADLAGVALTTSSCATLVNVLADTCSGWGFANTTAGNQMTALLGCASNNCTSGDRQDTSSLLVVGHQALAGSGRATVSTTDLTPNTTAGKGALLRGGGWPGAIRSGNWSGYPDVGAVQAQPTAGGTTTTRPWAHWW